MVSDVKSKTESGKILDQSMLAAKQCISRGCPVIDVDNSHESDGLEGKGRQDPPNSELCGQWVSHV